MLRWTENLSYRALISVENLRRTMPVWLLMILMLALEACGGGGKKK